MSENICKDIGTCIAGQLHARDIESKAELDLLRAGLNEIADKANSIPALDGGQHDALVAIAMKARALASTEKE